MDQLENFKDIMEFKRQNKYKAILLIGNHDFHYMPEAKETYSGYQDQYAYLIKTCIADARRENMLQMAWQWKNILFTHAGVSKTFLDSLIAEADTVAERLNDSFYFKPTTFRFNGYNSGGEDITQSCIWIRPRSLATNAVDGHVQVVGHTRMADGILNVGNFWFIDTLEDKNKQYLRITEDKFEACYVNTK